MMLKRATLFSIIYFFLVISFAFSQKYQPVTAIDEQNGGITVMTKDALNKFLIAGDSKGNLYFLDLATAAIVKKIKAHAAEVSQLRFNSNGKLLISATHDGEIKIFDFAQDKIIQAIYSPDYSGIRFVIFSIADGFVYFNGNRKLFKTRSDLSQKVEEIINEEDTITDAVITTDRNSLIYSTGCRIKVINTRTDILRQDFKIGASKIERIALVKDSLLATWSQDGTIYFWHYNLGQIDPNPLFFLKAGNPGMMNFSENSKLMCSGNIGNWARIWQPMERKIIQELFAHTSTVTSSCFGISDDDLYTGSLDGKIILWKKGAPPPIPMAPVVEVIQKPDSNVIAPKPDIKATVEMSDANIPKIISGRKVISSQDVEVNSPDLTIYVYDNSYIDGDTMSLFFNGTWILDHYGVTKTKKPIELKLTPNTNNYLVLFANNMGKSPPNTAAIEYDDGTQKRFFKLSSDLKSCSAINFHYKK